MISSNMLLVDNNKMDVLNTKAAFLTIGIDTTLHCAESDIEAWAMLQGDHKISPIPKIMLIDINQNGIDGLILLQKIRKDPVLKSMLVFVITRTNNNENKEASLNLNVAAYMCKPSDSENKIEFFSKLNDYWNIIEYPSYTI
jgi:CheY-like chemotaxis protein